jgi:hypothetical protein
MPDFSDQVRTPPAQFDLTGKTVGRFVIEARLGAGGMGEVYRANVTHLRRTCRNRTSFLPRKRPFPYAAT